MKWHLLLAALMLLRAVECHAQNQLPRYKLQVGQEFVYRGGSELKSEKITLVHRNSWKIWVVRENPDGSWRLLLRHGDAFHVRRGKVDEDQKVANNEAADESQTFGWCDIFPDGRIVENSSLSLRLQPSKLLPRLPRNQSEADRGWVAADKAANETLHYRMLPDDGSHRCQIEVVAESAQNTVFGIDEKVLVTLDTQRGFPKKMILERSQAYAPKGQGQGKVELIEVQTHSAESSRRFADESDSYFAAEAAYEAALQRKDLSRDELPGALEKAAEGLRNVGDTLQTAELKERVAERLKNQRADMDDSLESLSMRETLLGTPSEDWSTTDLDGKAHALKDYRGKVIVLDFWYRGCGWCIVAMPQIKEIVAHFQDRPVAVLGMNIDQDQADAEFVVEKLSLRYTNLKAAGLPKKYHVRAFPTLVIIDQDGVVREFHEGFSPTLREEVIKSVEQLLGPKS